MCQKQPPEVFYEKMSATLLKCLRLWHKRFPVNFAKFLRAPFLQNTSGRLLLMCLWEVVTSYCETLWSVSFVFLMIIVFNKKNTVVSNYEIND